MIRLWDWEYRDVPRLGTVQLSPEALHALYIQDVNDSELFETLERGTDIRAFRNPNYVGREFGGVRLVIRTWPHIPGAAAVCVNGYRVPEVVAPIMQIDVPPGARTKGPGLP